MVETDYCGLVLNVSNDAFFRERPFEIPVWGKPMNKWVALAFGDAPVQFIGYREDIEIPVLIKDFLTDSEYTVVLFSDTPLIQKKTILEALNFVKTKGLNVCRMTRGYVFKTEYIAQQAQVYSQKRYYFSDEDDFITASDFNQLSLISEIMRQRILRFHMTNGVHIVDAATCYIDGDVIIEKNVTIHPSNTLKGSSLIKSGVVLNNGNTIVDSIIGADAVVTSSNIQSSKIGSGTTVGPYAYIRPESVIGEGCRIGDFVEIKKSKIGKGSKVSHLAYIGDCEMGQNCNIGCGCITANYDGKNKSKTIIGNNVFVGSNSNLIAPITLGDNSFVAAGSTITKDVNNDVLVIARVREQVEKKDWKRKK